MKTIDRETLIKLRKDMQLALADLEKKYGLTVKVGNASYTDNYANFKVEIATTSSDGTVNTKISDDFKRLAPFYGLKESDLNSKFVLSSLTGPMIYKLVGFSAKARKKSIDRRERRWKTIQIEH